MRDDDDEADNEGFLSDTEHIHKLRGDITHLGVRVAVLEDQLKRLDLWKVREDVAVLKARTESLIDDRISMGRRFENLMLAVLSGLTVTLLNLFVSLYLAGR